MAHRDAALTGLLQVLTWLGSNWVLAPVLAAAVLALLMRRWAGDAAVLAMAYLGGTGLYLVVKALMQRPRPPAADLLTAASGWSFPSGHATQAMVGWGALAVLLAGRAPRLRPWLLTGAALLVLLIGGSRVTLWLASRAGRLAGGASRRLRQGSGVAVHGGVILKLAPDALARLAAGRQTALVSGTNGKTTTTRLLAAALGAQVATNGTAANRPSGLVSALDRDRLGGRCWRWTSCTCRRWRGPYSHGSWWL